MCAAKSGDVESNNAFITELAASSPQQLEKLEESNDHIEVKSYRND